MAKLHSVTLELQCELDCSRDSSSPSIQSWPLFQQQTAEVLKAYAIPDLWVEEYFSVDCQHDAFRYPNNPVLRFITPKDTCRKLDIYPVKLTQDAISIDVSGAALTASSPVGKGGSDTSIDANNVFGLESRPYYEGQDPVSESLPITSQQQAKCTHLFSRCFRRYR